MKISNVKVWEKGKWSVSKNEDKYEGLCNSVLSNLLAKADVAICSYVRDDRVISKAMYIMKKEGNGKFWFNSDNTAELTQMIAPKVTFTILIYDKESVESLMLTGKMGIEENVDIRRELWREEFKDWYIDGIQSEDYVVIRFQAEEYRIFSDGVQIEMKERAE